MAEKQSSAEMSSLAARVMNGYAPTREEIVSMAASIMSQDETPTTEEVEAALAITIDEMRGKSKIADNVKSRNDPAEEAEASAAPVQKVGQ